jgi:hypothetical protein
MNVIDSARGVLSKNYQNSFYFKELLHTVKVKFETKFIRLLIGLAILLLLISFMMMVIPVSAFWPRVHSDINKTEVLRPLVNLAVVNIIRLVVISKVPLKILIVSMTKL